MTILYKKRILPLKQNTNKEKTQIEKEMQLTLLDCITEI